MISPLLSTHPPPPRSPQALREAVDLLGTKDWAAIHARMRTDRSIKQVPAPSIGVLPA